MVIRQRKVRGLSDSTVAVRLDHKWRVDSGASSLLRGLTLAFDLLNRASGLVPKPIHLPMLALVLAGCTTIPLVGETPAEDPPRLVMSDERDKSGRELLTWDRPGAFGRVPADKVVLGNATCLTARVDLEAIGYHPRAKNSNGKEMPGGGFFCAVKAQGDKPAANAPRLVRTGGVLGWDNPAAFGAVPKDASGRGDAICQKAGSHLEAIGYHPQARNENNTPIVGGGFFCGPKNTQ